MKLRVGPDRSTTEVWHDNGVDCVRENIHSSVARLSEIVNNLMLFGFVIVCDTQSTVSLGNNHAICRSARSNNMRLLRIPARFECNLQMALFDLRD